jgi:hypothetical protein
MSTYKNIHILPSGNYRVLIRSQYKTISGTFPGLTSAIKFRDSALHEIARLRGLKKMRECLNEEPSLKPEARIDPSEWRAIPNFPGYEVSEKGNVRSMKPSAKRVGFYHFPKVTMRNGYPAVQLSLNSKTRVKFVHTLVAEAFCGAKPFDGAQVGHINDMPLDNRAENLRWVTPAQNAADKIKNKDLFGKNINSRKKNDARILCNLGLSAETISRILNLDAGAVTTLINGVEV